MNKNNASNLTCELTPVLNIFSKKWTTIILREIDHGNTHYGTLKKSIPNISSRSLALRLKDLENHGIIKRTIYPVIPPSIEYNLTDKGKDTHKIFDKMLEWKNKW